MSTTIKGEHLSITVVIAAKNEAANIADCIDSVQWADEILVAEHGSDDETSAIAERTGARVVHSTASTIGKQRNEAIGQATHPWILVIDADERGSLKLRDAIVRVLNSASEEAFRIPRRNFFCGKEIKYGGWGVDSDRPIRLFRSHLRYNDSMVHERVVTIRTPGVLDESLLHYPYESLHSYFEKFNLYSHWWAEQQWERQRHKLDPKTRDQVISALVLFFKPIGRFFKMYVIKLGFLDGVHGLVLALLASASVFARNVRLWGKQVGR